MPALVAVIVMGLHKSDLHLSPYAATQILDVLSVIDSVCFNVCFECKGPLECCGMLGRRVFFRHS